LLLAGLVIAARHGFEMQGALDYASKTYVDVNIHKAENKEKLMTLNQLPGSCWESANELSAHRDIFEKHGVFNAEMIDDMIKYLKSFNDKNIREEVAKDPDKMMEMVNAYFHCG
jgi:glutamine synthetase